MWGEILTAGASIAGSLFGKKEQKTKTSMDLTELVNQANGNGFNPLTVLRNGGSAGFTTTTSPTVSQLPEALGSLGGVLGGALEEKLDPIQAKKRELDTALVDAQLRSLKQGAMPAGFYQPRTYSGTKVSQQLVPRLGAASHKQTASVPAALKSDMGYVPADPPTVTNPYPKGFEPDPNTPDASVVEDRLGDDLLSPGFWSVWPRDATHNFDKWLTDRGLPLGPNDMGARIRKNIIELWNKPGTRKPGGRSRGVTAPGPSWLVPHGKPWRVRR